MDKNTELLLHILFLQRDHSIGFRPSQLVGILFSVFCELKHQGVSHEYSYTFKRGDDNNPTSPELLEIIKSLVTGKYLEQGRNPRNEVVYKLGVKGAMVGSKMVGLDSTLQNSLMAWVGYYLPMSGSQLIRELNDKFKLVNFKTGDRIPLQSPFAQKIQTDDWF